MAALAFHWADWLDWLLPPRCGGCRRRGYWLCPACQMSLTPLPAPSCQRCGRPIVRAERCRRCRLAPPAFDRAWSAYHYAGPLRQAIHRFKYGGERGLGRHLGQHLTRCLPAELGQVDLVVPVPLHPSRYRQRGYNQSELLARSVADGISCPLRLDLQRHRSTPPQVGRTAQARRQNLAGAFVWLGSRLAGQRILLIDDVLTTGATLEACAQALRPSGPRTIVAATLARGTLIASDP